MSARTIDRKELADILGVTPHTICNCEAAWGIARFRIKFISRPVLYFRAGTLNAISRRLKIPNK